jgi:hypothetical protein
MAITKVTRTLLSTGIVDNSNATAITIDSSERVLIGTDSGDAFNDDAMLRLQRQGDRVFQSFKVDADQEAAIFFGDVDDDVECGIQYQAANRNLIFSTGNNAEALRIISTGEVGIGITPVAHYTGYKALDIGTAMSLFSNSGGTNVATMTNNGYLNSGASQWTYKVTDEATMYSQVHGDHRFSTAASGSAGAAITWSEKVRIQAAGGISFNGDTAAANALDDYEEGSFTPTFSSSNSTATGSYTKIGNQVTVHFRVISTGGLPSGGSQVQVGNLPFTIASGFGGVGGLYVGPSNVSSATGGGGTIVPYVTGGESFIRFLNVDTGTFGYTLWGELEVSHNNVVTAIGTVTYQV